MSRQIGPLKPLNAGGGRNTAQGECVCVFMCLCACACVIPSGNPPWAHRQGGDQACLRVCVWGISGDIGSYGFSDLDAMKWLCGSFKV